MTSFQNRHVLITGGSSGIGLALAKQCAADGARVSLVARDKAKLDAARDAILTATPGASVALASADVAFESQVQTALAALHEVHGPVDVLITSAGIARPGYFEEIPMEVFERTMSVNYFGTLYPVKALVPGMRKRGKGAIVIISSGAGLVGFFGYAPYAPTKFALRGLAEVLRGELKPAGIHVMIVYPPDTDTPQLVEESLTKPVETKAITAGGGLWTAEAVAQVTLKGLRKRRFSVAPGLQLTALLWLHSLIAPILNWSFDRVAASARKKADGSKPDR
jgi:3-dehydrosphinganine reductase